MRKRRSFGKEFKLEAVKLVNHGGLTVPAAARDLAVNPSKYRQVLGLERPLKRRVA